MNIFSQNYTVGIPVSDSVTSIFYTGNIDCQSNPALALSLPYSSVTGVESIFIINSSAPVTSVPGGLLNTIDTLYPVQSGNNYEIYVPYGETFSGTIKFVGVPEIAGEQYGCNTFGWNSIGTICPTVYSFFWGNSCIVSELTSIHHTTRELNDYSFEIYPNPSNAIITISLRAELEPDSQINMYDVAGRQIGEWSIVNDKKTIDVSNFAEGVYVIQLQTSEGIVNKKFVKQN
jgi:hypothetical protein